MLAGAVAAGDVPGVAALVAGRSGVSYAGAFGLRQAGRGDDMTADTVVWIASMTKPLTAVAALRLVERGRLALDEPLVGLLPELAAVRVLAGFAADGSPRLRPPRRPVTLRRLLSHTAGFGSALFNADVARFQTHAGLPPLGECREVTLLGTPLLFDPGKRWEYGTGNDWAGRAVERASGQTLEDYLGEHVCGPLGMADTGFLLRPDQRARLARVHRRQPDGSLAPDAYEVTQRPEFFLGGGGLYSTAADYLRFARMLLGGGHLDGARVLRPETAAMLGAPQTGALPVGRLAGTLPTSTGDIDLLPGTPTAWGFGGLIAGDDTPDGRAAGSWGWAGLANTHFWVDPTRGLAAVFVAQVLPFGDRRVLTTLRAFQRAVYGLPPTGARADEPET